MSGEVSFHQELCRLCTGFCSIYLIYFEIFVCFCNLFHPVAASTQLNEGVKHRSELSDDDPLYDSVASDEDYVTAEQLAKCLKLGVCI